MSEEQDRLDEAVKKATKVIKATKTTAEKVAERLPKK